MKIGIISDIHAYIEPLKRAISLFNSQEVDQIICAGDLVDGGWDEDEVIDTIRSYNIISVRGNHDREAFANQIEPDGNEWDDNALSNYKIQYLNTLSQSHQFNWEGIQVDLTHGAPWSDTYHVFPNTSSDTCKRILDTTKSDIVILGHTRVPMRLKINEKWIFNSGSLAGNRENLQRTCGILTLPQIKFELFDVDTGKILTLDTRIIETEN